MPPATPVTVHDVIDTETGSISYVVHSGPNNACAIIDAVLQYDPKSGRTRTTAADALIAYVQAHHLQLVWILETHAHADHLSAAAYLKGALGGRTAIGRGITRVQEVFKGLFNLGPDFVADGHQFDRLLDDGDVLTVGPLTCRVIATPGHTPACVAYQFADAVFVGDTLFMPDVGTARCDFPGGDAPTLYQSIQKLLSLPPQTRLFMCHDYPPTPRPFALVSTVAEQRQHNIHVHEGVTEAAFVTMRQQRDATLDMPVLILPSIQVNIRAGALPPAEANGTHYLKVPVNAL